jgi:cyclase
MPTDRRQFLVTASGILAASAFDFRSVWAQGGQQAPPATAFTPVRRSVGIFTGQGGTIGWHVDQKGAVVIDSQFPATARICLEGVKQRASGRPIDYLVNTHHHGDHVGGNAVFQPEVKKILAHVNVPKLQKEAAERAAQRAGGGQAAAPQVYATATYEKTWREPVGDEVMALRYYGPAHTSGDSVVTFEKANVVHMGDLVFNRLHPYIDKPAGASIANWMKALDQVVADHAKDTIYVFGHAGQKFTVTGTGADLAAMRDYLAGLLEFVRKALKAGTPREAIVKITEPLPGFPDQGPLIERVLSAACDELTA